MLKLVSRLPAATLLALPLLAGLAHADNLQARPGDPLWMHIGADALLYAHIGGGAVVILP